MRVGAIEAVAKVDGLSGSPSIELTGKRSSNVLQRSGFIAPRERDRLNLDEGVRTELTAHRVMLLTT